MRVLVGGSHGLVGSRLVERLKEEGHSVVRLVRLAETEDDVRWDPSRGPVDIKDMELFDAVIHLGGVSIGEKRWSEYEKARLWDSRVVSTDVLVAAFKQLVNPPKVFLCASAVGYYGDQGDTELTEASPAGTGFLSELCQQWEKSAQEASELGIRVASLRSGVVFSTEGGMIKRQIPLFRLLLGGRLGSGNQWMSWIDIDDEVNAIIHVLENDKISGPVNLTSPEPVTNAEFTTLFASSLRRFAVIPAPRWMLTAALGGQLTDEMLLSSARVTPKKLLDNGFEFQYANPARSLLRQLAPEQLNEFLEEQAAEEEIDLGPRLRLKSNDDGIGNGNGPSNGHGNGK